VQQVRIGAGPRPPASCSKEGDGLRYTPRGCHFAHKMFRVHGVPVERSVTVCVPWLLTGTIATSSGSSTGPVLLSSCQLTIV